MSWFTRLFRRRGLYDDLAEEIRAAHRRKDRAHSMRDGMSREEAEHAARRAFGNVTLIEERGREAWQWPQAGIAVADARFGLRQLRRSPGFAVTAVSDAGAGDRREHGDLYADRFDHAAATALSTAGAAGARFIPDNGQRGGIFPRDGCAHGRSIAVVRSRSLAMEPTRNRMWQGTMLPSACLDQR